MDADDKERDKSGSHAVRADARRNVRSILEAAARLLADDPSASMQSIAAAAEVTRPTVYRHFASREELVDAIRLEVMDQAREKLDAAAASSEPAAEALERLIGDLAAIVSRYPLLATMVGERHPPPTGRHPEAVTKAFTALVERGARDGTLRAGLSAATLQAVTMGSLLMALKMSGRGDGDPDEIGANVAAAVLDGVRGGRSA